MLLIWREHMLCCTHCDRMSAEDGWPHRKPRSRPDSCPSLPRSSRGRRIASHPWSPVRSLGEFERRLVFLDLEVIERGGFIAEGRFGLLDLEVVERGGFIDESLDRSLFSHAHPFESRKCGLAALELINARFLGFVG